MRVRDSEQGQAWAWRSRALFASSSQALPSQAESISFGCSQGLISQTLYHIFLYTVTLGSRLGGHGHKESYTKHSRSWATASKVELTSGTHIS